MFDPTVYDTDAARAQEVTIEAPPGAEVIESDTHRANREARVARVEAVASAVAD